MHKRRRRAKDGHANWGKSRRSFRRKLLSDNSFGSPGGTAKRTLGGHGDGPQLAKACRKLNRMHGNTIDGAPLFGSKFFGSKK